MQIKDCSFCGGIAFLKGVLGTGNGAFGITLKVKEPTYRNWGCLSEVPHYPLKILL